MKVGNLDLTNKLIMAPLAEVTYAPFRKIVTEFGAGLKYTQMVSAEGILKNNFQTLKFLVYSRDEKPIGVQILGKDPDIIAGAVSELKKIQPDVIDLNCGCSVHKVLKHKMGAAILDDTPLLGRIVKSMKKSSGEIPISVKMRLGSTKTNSSIIDNAKACEENGASFIVVHCRYRSNSYNDDSDWEMLKKVKDSVSIPVVGNGSIFTPEDAINMREQTGVDSVMVARGALGNPFIFSRYNSIMEKGIDPGEPGLEEKLNIAIRHLNMLVSDSGERSGIIKAKKHLFWYFRLEDGIYQLVEKVKKLKEVDDIIGCLHEHVDNIAANKFEKLNIDEINKSFNERVMFWQID
ncbi:MAG: tRNA dihydrouridine synthase DusB [Melioribacteraceae bacterium]|nr:tRNA dihydrouridine synthase DusB [Melioribacteraceae bacterium]